MISPEIYIHNGKYDYPTFLSKAAINNAASSLCNSNDVILARVLYIAKSSQRLEILSPSCKPYASVIKQISGELVAFQGVVFY